MLTIIRHKLLIHLKNEHILARLSGSIKSEFSIFLIALLCITSSRLHCDEWYITSIQDNSFQRITADSKFIVSDDDSTILFINTENFKCNQYIKKFSNKFTSSRVLPELNAYVSIGRRDSSYNVQLKDRISFSIVDLYDLSNQKLINRKEFGIVNSPYSDVSQDLRYFYGIDNQYFIYVFDYQSEELLIHLDSTQALRAFHIDLSDDGTLIAGVYKDKIFVYNVITGELLSQWGISGGMAHWKVKLSPDKKKIIIYSSNMNYIYCYYVDSPNLYDAYGTDFTTIAADFDSSSEKIIVSSSEGIKEYEFQSGAYNHKIKLNEMKSADFDILNINNMILTVSDSIIVWNEKNSQRISSYPVNKFINKFDYNFDNDFIYIFMNKMFYRYDTKTGTRIQEYDQNIGRLLKNKNQFLNFKKYFDVKLIDIFTTDTVLKKELPYPTTNFSYSEDLKYYFFSDITLPNVGKDATVIYDWETDEEIYVNDSVFCLKFSPKSSYIYSFEGTKFESDVLFRLRTFPEAELILEFDNVEYAKYYSGAYINLHFPYITEDEKYLYIIRDSFLLKYELPSGIMANSFKRLPDGSKNYLVSKNNRYLLEALANGDIMIRDLISDVVIDSIQGINSPVSQMGLSSDEKYFFVNYEAGYLRVMSAPGYIVSVSEAKEETKNYIEILPNPASSKIRLLIGEDNSPFIVTIYSILGMNYNILSYDRVGEELTLDVSNLGTGIYIVFIKYRDGSTDFGKFIKL
jgi:hypothetical protein